MQLKTRVRKTEPNEDTDIDIIIDCLKEIGFEEIPRVSCPIFKKDTNITECSCECRYVSNCQEFKNFKYIMKACFKEGCTLYNPCTECIDKIHKVKTLVLVLQTITGLKENIRYRSIKYANMIDNSEHKYYQKRLMIMLSVYNRKKRSAKTKTIKF